uniref:Reverse transcriptase zinc-binding domain-containing protein n=1 Tax=Vitis vinifera TaxID=29760 RepID=A5C8F9_VITVI|nr:hypothetical protein VITISV_017219 [Vitis vinifera]
MDWVSPRSISDMFFTNFNGFGSSKRGVVLWQDACIALMWVVWRERNARIFEDKFAIMGHNNVKSLDYRSAVKDTDEWPSKYSKLFIESVAVWDGVEERFRKRLALWKRQFISKGGRITLIRSTLSSMPIYLMSLLRMPRVVSLRLEKIERDFLRGGGALERKPHLVNWDTVCMDKRKGGLGVRRLSILNRALLCKWNWRFANEREKFWRHVISRKFGLEEGGWVLEKLRRVMEGNKEGRRVKFWKDIWWGNFALCNSFPSLYAIASSKEAWVEEFWDTSGVEGAWSPRFSRPFNDWEVEEVERLLLTIRGARLIPLMEDRMMWKVTSNGIFSVKSLYNDLSSRRAGLFPHGLIWNPSVPSKVGFFAWEASWGKVLTMDQLKKRGWALANRCFLCCEEEESIDHILIHCSRARALWEFLFALFGVFWVLPSSARDTLIEWRGFMLGKKHRKRDLQTLSTTRRSSLVIRMDFGTCLQFLFLVAVDPISMAAKTQKFTEPTIT